MRGIERVRKYLETNIYKIQMIALIAILIILTGEIVAAKPDSVMGMSASTFFALMFIFCVIIGIVTQIAGTGGGVIFTTLLLGFTNIHPDIVRATGLLAAMSGTKMSARRFLKRGLANIRIVLLMGVTYTVFAIIGAIIGLYITKSLGTYGIALIKLLLGLIVLFVGVIYLTMKRVEYPEVREEEIDKFTEKLGLEFPYWEESLQKVVNYRVRRAWLGILLFCGVGLVSGMFGLGAGWAVTPVLNLAMLTPLKVATATSVTMISLGDTAAIFPYLMSNSIVPIFAVPAVAGLMTGAEIGSRIAVRVKPKIVRYILIGILFFAGIRLIITGLTLMGVI